MDRTRGVAVGRYICNRLCWHNTKLWKPGEIAEFNDGAYVPRHFTRIDDPVPDEPQNEPITVGHEVIGEIKRSRRKRK